MIMVRQVEVMSDKIKVGEIGTYVLHKGKENYSNCKRTVEL